MTRPYNERRNREVFILVERRRVHPKDVPAIMLKLGHRISYDSVRQIVRRYRSHHLKPAVR
jgi:hypothetical protein